MDQPNEQTAAILTQILFSKLAHRFFDKYTDYEMQSEFLMREIMKVYRNFLDELNTPMDSKKK